jgi:hypothetical protein
VEILTYWFNAFGRHRDMQKISDELKGCLADDTQYSQHLEVPELIFYLLTVIGIFYVSVYKVEL